jgi:predicted HTH transcriptional regulator
MEENQQTTPADNTHAPEITQTINTDTPVITTDSTSVEVPLEALESSTNVVDAPSNKDDNGASIPAESQTILDETKPEELPPSASLPEETPPTSQTQTQTAQMVGNEPIRTQSFIRQLLEKAKLAIQSRKRKKLDKIMNLFARNPSSTAKLTTGQASITNDDVQKLLYVSDATATRYLSILEKEGKIKQDRKTGKGVLYTKL